MPAHTFSLQDACPVPANRGHPDYGVASVVWSGADCASFSPCPSDSSSATGSSALGGSEVHDLGGGHVKDDDVEKDAVEDHVESCKLRDLHNMRAMLLMRRDQRREAGQGGLTPGNTPPLLSPKVAVERWGAL